VCRFAPPAVTTGSLDLSFPRQNSSVPSVGMRNTPLLSFFPSNLPPLLSPSPRMPTFSHKLSARVRLPFDQKETSRLFSGRAAGFLPTHASLPCFSVPQWTTCCFFIQLWCHLSLNFLRFTFIAEKTALLDIYPNQGVTPTPA